MSDANKYPNAAPAPWQALSEPNAEVLDVIEQLIRKGMPLASVARSIATTETRLKRWLERGEVAVDEENWDESERIYSELFLRAARAQSLYEESQLDSLNDPDNGNWRRPLSILERRDARNWDRKPMDEGGDSGEEFEADQKFV